MQRKLIIELTFDPEFPEDWWGDAMDLASAYVATAAFEFSDPTLIECDATVVAARWVEVEVEAHGPAIPSDSSWGTWNTGD